jgi:hypothetical protein
MYKQHIKKGEKGKIECLFALHENTQKNNTVWRKNGASQNRMKSSKNEACPNVKCDSKTSTGLAKMSQTEQ